MVVVAADGRKSVGALFTDIRSAYCSIIRQYIVGFEGPDDQFCAILPRLNLSAEVAEEALRFLHARGTLLQEGSADQP